MAQGHWQAQPSQARGRWTLSQLHRTNSIVTRQFAPYGGRIPTCPTGVRFHIQQESDIPASTQLYNQICFAIAARHYPPGIACPAPGSWRCKRACTETRSARCTANWKPMAWWKPWPAQASTCATSKSQEIKTPPHIRNRGVTDLDREVRKCVDGLLNAGCTLQLTRELLTREIDWRLRCGARVLVSTPREDIGASMLIAEELEPCLDVPVEVVPMEELESVLENSSNGTVVTSRYFLQRMEELAKKHRVRAVAVDLNDFSRELAMLKELRAGSCVGLVSISPGILRAAEVILHSMRGNELLLMTSTPMWKPTVGAAAAPATYSATAQASPWWSNPYAKTAPN